jgi:hypothetical protein
MKCIELGSLQMDDIFGIHDVSKGQVPSGVSSGVALNILKDADDSRLGLIKIEMELGHATLGKMVLDIVKLFVKEPRIFRSISGEERESEVIDFMGTDLTWRNVRVEMGAKQNRLAKQQSAIELLQYGGLELFDTIEARRALFSAAGMKDASIVMSNVHERRAEFENAQLRRMEQPYITDYQNHEIHLKVLEDWMNSLEFDKEPDQVKRLALMHRMEHQQQLQMQMMQQLQMQAMATAAQTGPSGGDPNASDSGGATQQNGPPKGQQ